MARNNQVQTSLGDKEQKKEKARFDLGNPIKPEDKLIVVLLNLNPCYKKEVSLIFLK